MYKFILFFKRISFVLLFIAIEAFALHHFSNSSSYNQAKMINASNFLVGDLYAGISAVRHYFSLGRENRQLTAEVARLREELARYRQGDTLSGNPDTAGLETPYYFNSARVINNFIVRDENFLTLNKGLSDGIKPEMAVLSDGAIVGYILNCSEKFSVAISVLNTKFRTSGRILGEDYFGQIYWDGQHYDEIILSEVAKYAPMAVGDTIVTEHSSFFPPGSKIGTVESFELINGTYYEARLKLFANMRALNHVVVVDYVDREERTELEHETVSRQQMQ